MQVQPALAFLVQAASALLPSLGLVSELAPPPARGVGCWGPVEAPQLWAVFWPTGTLALMSLLGQFQAKWCCGEVWEHQHCHLRRRGSHSNK